jgi:hypothetical protein
MMPHLPSPRRQHLEDTSARASDSMAAFIQTHRCELRV